MALSRQEETEIDIANPLPILPKVALKEQSAELIQYDK
jgi:hypothetical protein